MKDQEPQASDVEEKERMKKDEDVDTDEDKKKKKKGKTETAQSPEETSASGNDANSSITPGQSTPSQTQPSQYGNTGISSGRNANTGSATNGIAPIDVHYSGKSATPDFNKSPVFVELSKQLESMQDAMEKKFEAISKSFNDRVDNMLTQIAKTEKALKDFYSQPFYKSVGENAAPESTVSKTIAEQVEAGKVRWSY